MKAVITAADLPDISSEEAAAGEPAMNFRDLSCNCLARGKVLYEGHAVAATSGAVAAADLALIEIEYQPLPHVIDVEAAMAPEAPLLHDDLFTQGVEPVPRKPSNIATRVHFSLGDVAAGFRAAAVILERRYTTKPVHQAYIEPLALALAKKAGRPVKMVMTREEVFRATGPTSGAVVEVKLGATRDGKITAAQAVLKYQAGAFPGSPVQPGCMAAFAMYDLQNVSVTGYDVVSNRPKVAAYRAPGAPIASFGVESCVDELAHTLGMDPIALRQRNAARDGTRAAYGPTFRDIGYVETLAAAQRHPHYAAALGPHQGRGVASGFWFNIGGESTAAVHINEDGTAVVVSGNPDIGGSRAALAMMAAEVLGIPVDRVRPIVADTSSIGYSLLTGGSRVTFATGMAVVQAAEKVVGELTRRAAKIHTALTYSA